MIVKFHPSPNRNASTVFLKRMRQLGIFINNIFNVIILKDF
jgi:hypothetical protein